jgi:hypothetical protein
MNSSPADSRVNCLKASDVSETHSVSILRESDLTDHTKSVAYIYCGWLYILWLATYTVAVYIYCGCLYIYCGWLYTLWLAIYTVAGYIYFGWLYIMWLAIYTVAGYTHCGWLYILWPAIYKQRIWYDQPDHFP